MLVSNSVLLITIPVSHHDVPHALATDKQTQKFATAQRRTENMAATCRSSVRAIVVPAGMAYSYAVIARNYASNWVGVYDSPMIDRLPSTLWCCWPVPASP